MRRQPLILFALLVAISGATMWARWPVAQPVAASEPSAIAQTSLPATPTTTPTPLAPMATPSTMWQVESDWQTYTSPYWGISFRYPPDWSVRGAETQVFIANASEEQRIAWTIGSLIILSSTEGNQGEIYIILSPYTLSNEGSLAEWVTIYNEYSGMMGMGPSPQHLSSIPAAYLPAGIARGVFSIGERRVNPPRVLWLEREGLVYSFSSTYNRPEDLALIFAIVASLEFDPDIETTVRASGGLQGDEETLRQKIAEMNAQIVPGCDRSCEYINFMAEVARWKTLPAPERPLVQPIRPAIIDDSWQRYTQPLLGISFRYGAFAEVIDPFVENNLDESSLFDEAITIKRKNGSSLEEVMKIELSPYTVSDGVPLNNWEAIQDQLNRARNPFHQFQYRLIVPIAWNYLAHHVDDIVHTQDQAPYYRVETFWISRDGIVFRITSSYPPLAQEVPAIISTMEFDAEQLEKLRSLGVFAGDERTMVVELQEAWANPLPTVDPQATATPIPTMTPRPTATPTPIIRLTVTPSAFESPLVNGLKRYQGNTIYQGFPPFEIWFDPAVWQLSTNERGENYLVHQTIVGCEMVPQGWATHATPLAPITLSGTQWSLSYFPTTAGEFLAYTRGWDNISYTVLVRIPTPILEAYDPNHKSQCEQDAEAIIDTFIVVEPVSSRDILIPTVTPTPEKR